MMAARLTHRGFTLIELVVSIAVSGIVVVFASLFIKTPIDAYLSQSRHAELLDSLGAAWPQMERDIHAALPTSVREMRNGSIVALEMMTAVASAHYLSDPRTASFTAAGAINPPPGKYFLSIYNGTPYNSFLTQMTPASRTLTFTPNAANEVTIGVTPLFSFVKDSPVNHLYLVYSHPITYLCNETTGTIQRYGEYTLKPAQTSVDTDAKLMAAGAVRTLVARNITGCNFQALAENPPTQGQLVTLQITATRDGESVSALYQASVEKLQ
jgi:prepilin-type N-terminal cleavage/methylation domain-containing protein